jgi:hypothetical protein
MHVNWRFDRQSANSRALKTLVLLGTEGPHGPKKRCAFTKKESALSHSQER